MKNFTTRFTMLGALVALAVAGCNGGGASKSSGSASRVAPRSSTPTAPTRATTSGTTTPSTPATTPSTTPAATPGTTPATTPSPTPAPTPSPAPAPAPAPATGVLLRGALPVDPQVGFSGLLFLSGERIVPGSMVLVGYQGVTAVLPGVFFSSQVLGVNVAFTVAGDFTFTAVAPDGSVSTDITVKVTAASAAPFTVAPPNVNMVWPPSMDTTFVGNVWLMGDHFLPGATLVGNGPTGPFVAPLVFVNERTLGWVTATPIAGSYSLAIMNPTFATSTTFTVTVGAPVAPAGTLPPPALASVQQSVLAPFVGSVRIYGRDFLPGAVVELKETTTGLTTATPVVFIGSAEAWWMLFYPAPGSYEATLRNPDGQATATWPFSVN